MNKEKEINLHKGFFFETRPDKKNVISNSEFNQLLATKVQNLIKFYKKLGNKFNIIT